MWKRVHQQVRTDLYIPQQTHGGPDVTQLGPARMSFVKPTNGNLEHTMDRFNKFRRTSIIQR